MKKYTIFALALIFVNSLASCRKDYDAFRESQFPEKLSEQIRGSWSVELVQYEAQIETPFGFDLPFSGMDEEAEGGFIFYPSSSSFCEYTLRFEAEIEADGGLLPLPNSIPYNRSRSGAYTVDAVQKQIDFRQGEQIFQVLSHSAQHLVLKTRDVVSIPLLGPIDVDIVITLQFEE